MKRDLDLIRRILLEVEARDQFPIYSDRFEFDGYDLVTINRHIVLLMDVNYLDAECFPDVSDMHLCIINRITMSGYDYLDSIRSNRVWDAVKRGISIVVGGAASASLDVIKQYASEVILKELGLG